MNDNVVGRGVNRGVKKIMFLLLIILSLSLFSSLINAINSTYYADLSIDVHEDGYVSFLGDTNYDYFNNLQTSKFTSKNKEVWTLNIDTQNDSFTNYYFELTLPDRAIINYVKAANINIDTSESRIRITGFDQDKPIKILVQYKIGPKKLVNTNTVVFFFLILLLVFGVFLFRAKIIQKYSVSKNGSENVIVDKIDFVNDRQKKIYYYVKKQGRVTQKELEKNLDMPKSSLSRNIDSLCRRGLISKKRLGMSNVLEIKRV